MKGRWIRSGIFTCFLITRHPDLVAELHQRILKDAGLESLK